MKVKRYRIHCNDSTRNRGYMFMFFLKNGLNFKCQALNNIFSEYFLDREFPIKQYPTIYICPVQKICGPSNCLADFKDNIKLTDMISRGIMDGIPIFYLLVTGLQLHCRGMCIFSIYLLNHVD